MEEDHGALPNHLKPLGVQTIPNQKSATIEIEGDAIAPPKLVIPC